MIAYTILTEPQNIFLDINSRALITEMSTSLILVKKNGARMKLKETSDEMQLVLTNSKSRKDYNNASRRYRAIAKNI